MQTGMPPPPHMLLRRPAERHAVRTPRATPRADKLPQHSDEWDGAQQTAGTMTRSELGHRVRARVKPLMELQDPDIFEVILFGANMLPIVKRRHEFEQLSQQLQGMQSGTSLLRINQQDPKLTAQDIQVRQVTARCA